MAQDDHSHVPNGHPLYYVEHGRGYGTFERGQYLGPVDDVTNIPGRTRPSFEVQPI